LQLLTTGATPELPQWIPADLRERIAAGSLPPGATRWPGEAPWGDIVIWVGAPSVAQHIEVYQEWPEDQAFYLEPAGDSAFLAGVLRDANATINRDMRTLVVEQGMAPSRARDRLRAVYDEVLVLVIDATVTALATSGGINVGALESKTDEIARAAQRRAAAGGGAALEGVVPAAETRIAPVDGCVNVGGVSERIGDWSDWTNLNANLQNWDLSSVRNLVVGRGEDMASLFVPGSVRAIASRRLPYDSTDVPAFARAAYEVMAEGGTLDLNFFGMLEIHEEVAAAFTAAGFKDVEVVDGVRVLGNR
jgi:hypothetical protein